jgi:hypothetical protein
MNGINVAKSQPNPMDKHLPIILAVVNILVFYGFFHDFTNADARFDNSMFWFGNVCRESAIIMFATFMSFDVTIFLIWLGEKKFFRLKSYLSVAAIAATTLPGPVLMTNFLFKVGYF